MIRLNVVSRLLHHCFVPVGVELVAACRLDMLHAVALQRLDQLVPNDAHAAEKLIDCDLLGVLPQREVEMIDHRQQ